MRAPRLIEVVVALSLALNCFMLGGFAYSRFVAPPPAQTGTDRRLERLAETLGLDPIGSKPFREFRQTVSRAQRQMNSQNSLVLDDIAAVLAQNPPDRERLNPLLDRVAANRRAFLDTVNTALIAFMATLTPDQRQALIDAVIDRSNALAAPMRNGIGG